MIKVTDYNIVFSEVPDEVTLALNISNCPNHCKGCHSPWLWDDIGEELSPQSLSDIIEKYKNEITCVCFMGGDGDQPKINSLAQFIKTHFAEIKTAWYSGQESIPDCIDLTNFNFIKLGRYEAEKGGLKSPTTNQRLYKILPNKSKEDITYKMRKNSI